MYGENIVPNLVLAPSLITDKKLYFNKLGIDIALANGIKFGRPKVQRPDNYNEVIELWKNKKITAREAMKQLNLKPNTFYNMVKENK